MSPDRPRLVTLLSLGVLIVSAVYLTRLVTGLSLPELPLTVPKWYVPLSGAIWGLSGLAIAYGLYRGRPWAVRLLAWIGSAYLVWYWIDRLAFMRTDYVQRSLPASAALTLLAVGAVVLALRRGAVRAYFEENPS